MRIDKNPKRIPRKIKKMMGRLAVLIIMNNPNCSYRARIISDMKEEGKWSYRYIKHELFINIHD